jgi:four helix bundle protein
MKENIIQTKSFLFALRIIELYRDLTTKQKEYIIAKQLLRSGTSIGANIEEAIGGQSRGYFLSKLSIAYKEARETYYWLRLLQESNLISNNNADSYILDCEELIKIMIKIQKSTKENKNS